MKLFLARRRLGGRQGRVFAGYVFSVRIPGICTTFECSASIVFFFLGFVEKEIRKANIPIMDTGENPEVPFPRDMIDLEVNNSQITF